MSKFKCKRCGRLNEKLDNHKDIKCQHCEEVHSWQYGATGWGYYLKYYHKSKCPACKKYIYPKRSELIDRKLVTSITCPECAETLIMIERQYSLDAILLPKNRLFFRCEWCDREIDVKLNDINENYINNKEEYFIEVFEEVVGCPYCEKKTKIVYMPDVSTNKIGDMIYTAKVLQVGRKKKANQKVIDLFLDQDVIYRTYSLVHPYNIEDFCDMNHYSYEEMYDLLEERNVEIFQSMESEQIADLEISDYEYAFDKLKLRESAKEEGGGISLSRLLGDTNAWKRMRQMLLDDYDYTCMICGYRTENTKALHAHEEWEYEGEKCILKNVTMICSRCHACKHRNEFVAYRVINGQSELVDGIPRLDLLAIHLMRVNNVSKEVIYAYRKKLLKHLREVREEELKQIMKSAQKEIEYKYVIDDAVVNKKELEASLLKKKLLYVEKDV